MSDQDISSTVPEKRLVWDLPLRLFHWLLAISIGLLWLTQKYGANPVPLVDKIGWLENFPNIAYATWLNVHMWLGYWVLGLIIFRVIWGFVGPRHARFSSFFPLPKRMIAYLRALAFGTESKPVGHNPLGSLMVFLMLALVGFQAVSGLFADDDIFTAGPYQMAVSEDTAEFFNGIHHSLFDYILIAIAIHVIAIVTYAVVLKQNLTVPMITGRKPAKLVPETEAITSSQLFRAAIVIIVAAAVIGWVIAAAPAPEF